MDRNIDHIINVEGILKNFSIAKKISASELRRIRKNAAKESTSQEEYTELLRREILRYTDEYVKKNKIPGIIIKKRNGLKSFNIKDPEHLKLYKEAALLAKDIIKNKALDKNKLIFFIMSLIGVLNLNQDDFNKFSAEMNKNPDFEEDEPWDGFPDDDDEDCD
jgi:hypothetical protein